MNSKNPIEGWPTPSVVIGGKTITPQSIDWGRTTPQPQSGPPVGADVATKIPSRGQE